MSCISIETQYTLHGMKLLQINLTWDALKDPFVCLSMWLGVCRWGICFWRASLLKDLTAEQATHSIR